MAEQELTVPLYLQVRNHLLHLIKGRPRFAGQAIFLSRSAYNLRRAGGRVTGICEWVVFAVKGSLEAVRLPHEDLIPSQQGTAISLGDKHAPSNL